MLTAVVYPIQKNHPYLVIDCFNIIVYYLTLLWLTAEALCDKIYNFTNLTFYRCILSRNILNEDLGKHFTNT